MLKFLLNSLNMSAPALTRHDFGLKTDESLKLETEILASAVETRNFVELKLGDLSTLPCLIVCNCNIRICSTFERSTAKSRISNAFPFLIILKPISKF